MVKTKLDGRKEIPVASSASTLSASVTFWRSFTWQGSKARGGYASSMAEKGGRHRKSRCKESTWNLLFKTVFVHNHFPLNLNVILMTFLFWFHRFGVQRVSTFPPGLDLFFHMAGEVLDYWCLKSIPALISYNLWKTPCFPLQLLTWVVNINS